MADFVLVVGKAVTAVPSAVGVDGNPIDFPRGTVFAWTSSDPNLVIQDAAAERPTVVAMAAVSGATLLLSVDEDGFHHEASHTVDAVAPAADTISAIDFTLQ